MKICGTDDAPSNFWLSFHTKRAPALYPSQKMIRVNKSRGMRWMVHTECMGEIRKASSIITGYQEGKRPLGRLGVNGRIILK
jgi:hypothetical protein